MCSIVFIRLSAIVWCVLALAHGLFSVFTYDLFLVCFAIRLAFHAHAWVFCKIAYGVRVCSELCMCLAVIRVCMVPIVIL